MLVVALVSLLAIGGLSAVQGKDKPEGKPFQALWEAITSLEDQVNGIEEDLDKNYINASKNPDYVARGCLACHNTYTNYTLVTEAYYRCDTSSECEQHPYLGPADNMSYNNTAEACMDCHDADMSDGALPFSDIVHPSHMNSHHFKYQYDGNCFSCHHINATNGEYELLTGNVQTHGLGKLNKDFYE